MQKEIDDSHELVECSSSHIGKSLDKENNVNYEVGAPIASKSIAISMRMILLGLLVVSVVAFSLSLFGGFNFISLLEIPLAYYEIISKIGLGVAIGATVLLVILGGRSTNSSSALSINDSGSNCASNEFASEDTAKGVDNGYTHQSEPLGFKNN